MKKKTFLKSLSFTSLALLMGAAGVFAFAPVKSTTCVAIASETVDQINTKADGENIKYAPSPLGLDPENDPVIYTTESGLEIKFGGAITALGGGNEKNDFAAETLPSGKALSGYPYFTMGTYNGYAVNWVIIGKSTTGIPTTSTTGMSDYNYEKLSTWQGKTSESPTYQHFFEQTYEATTPAGAAIKNSGTLNNYAARKMQYMFNPSILSSLPSKAEIDAGCVLAVSECCLGTSATYYYYNSSALRTAMQNLFNTTLNLSDAQKEMIVYQDDLKASADCYQSQIFTYEDYFFPLSWYKNDNFSIQDFLPSSADESQPTPLRVSYDITTGAACDYWLSDAASLRSYSNRLVCGILTSGACDGGVVDTVAKGVRPACVIKFA